MKKFEFVLLGLAVWRIATMLTKEQGPSHIFERMRYKMGIRREDGNPENMYAENPDSFIATLFLCIRCLSIWVAIPFFVVSLFSGRAARMLALIPALSAIACLVDAVEDAL